MTKQKKLIGTFKWYLAKERGDHPGILTTIPCDQNATVAQLIAATPTGKTGDFYYLVQWQRRGKLILEVGIKKVPMPLH